MAEDFFKEKMLKICREKSRIIDIGGGLRISKIRGNRYERKNEWLAALLKGKEYKILDPVPDYDPDIIGDIHHLPFPDNSEEAIICVSVLEHVEDPLQAARELYRVLAPGGYCYVYAPFLFYYHAERGYYHDYWRFTRDAMDLLFKDFSHREIQSARGPFETWIHLSPLGRIGFLKRLAAHFDRCFKKDSHQVSGYSVFLIK
jgi:SAM-dependent methyltransferase